MENTFFIHEIKRTKNTIEKGIVTKDTYDGAKQAYHSYIGAYAYGNNTDTDFVSCMITDMSGMILMSETWIAPVVES